MCQFIVSCTGQLVMGLFHKLHYLKPEKSVHTRIVFNIEKHRRNINLSTGHFVCHLLVTK